ncbi:multiheme c-type cytochrome [Haloferula sp.]|uniref:multiheme c-type cytochrome n=1 Tax=Haloferula sp. TaxID=2497595 RepID=UPI00329CC3A7
MKRRDHLSGFPAGWLVFGSGLAMLLVFGMGPTAWGQDAEETPPEAASEETGILPESSEEEMEDEGFGGEGFGGEGFGDEEEGFGDEGFGDEGGEEGFGDTAFGEEAFGGDDEEEEEEEPKVTFANAAEAHIRFLDLLESEKRFPSAAACAACHPDHFREWSVSAHAYSQVSPVFNAMHSTLFAATSGTNGDFCIRCHTQVGMQREEPILTSNFNRHPASLEGITCVVCHRIDKNYGKVSGRTSVGLGDVYKPVYGPKGNAILEELLGSNPTLKTGEDKEGQRKIHSEAIKFDPIATSGFCGSCHDVNLLNGFRLEEAFTQFKNSPASKDGETCQDCHMGKIPGAKVGDGDANYHSGPAARIGGTLWATNPDDEGYGSPTAPRKRTNHMFAGPDHSIVHPGLFPHSKTIRDLLWDMQNQVEQDNGDILIKERAGLKHIIDFKWEDGWGNANSSFEKRMAANPDSEAALPWPWNDRQYRVDFRSELNEQFRLLNTLNTQRFQVLRRGYQLGEFKVTRNDHKKLTFEVEVRNGTDGHGVPTGFDAERLVFLNVAVKDRYGRKIYESGDRDPNGDVRDLHSLFVHHNAKKDGAWLAASDWKAKAGLERVSSDTHWKEDKDLFSLQSKFLVRNQHGGEREQVLAVNYSVNPLPYIRPDTFPGILRARPGGARKHAVVLPPNGSRIAKYTVSNKLLTGTPPYTVNMRFISQMIPVNLIPEISGVGFDYNLSPREVAKRVVHGHRMSPSKQDKDRRGGALVLWDKTVKLDGSRTQWSFHPSEKEIMAVPQGPFPYDSTFAEKQAESEGIIEISEVEEDLPMPEPIPSTIDPDAEEGGGFDGEGFDGEGFGE